MSRPEWDPLKELVGVHKRMNQLFERALTGPNFETQEGVDSWRPDADVYETGSALVMEVELPGLSQEAIEIRVDSDELVVEGERNLEREGREDQFHRVERAYGKFSRRFRLPSTVDRDRIEATYRHGVLTVTLPKSAEHRPTALKVPIR